MSTQACATASKAPIGCPNCTRSFAYAMVASRHQPMPPAASAAVASRKSRSARSNAATASSPWPSSTAGTSSKAVTQTRRVRSRPSCPEAVYPRDLDSTRNIARPDSVTAGTTTMSATWPATTYHRCPYSRQPPGARSARTLSGPGDQWPASPAAARVPVTDPSASNGSQCSAAARSPARSTPPARLLDRNGPGYRARPSSVCTTLASAWDMPRPPNSSGIISPVRPSSPARRACSSGLWPASVSSAARSTADGSWSARKLRRMSCRACWSSLRARVSLSAMISSSRRAWEPEDPLRDGVPQDLVGSAAQPVPRRTEHHRGPRVGSPGTGVGDQGWPENGGHELGQPLHVSGQSQLIQGNLGARWLARRLEEKYSLCRVSGTKLVIRRAAYLVMLPGQLVFDTSSGCAPVKAPAAVALPRRWYSSQAVA